MELEVALKIGFLSVPSQNFLRKAWSKRYCALYNSSNHGIQRIELFETEDGFVKQCPIKIIPLTDCWKVTPLPQKQQANVFEVRTKDNSHQFSADTFQEMSEWLVSLQSVAFSKPSQSNTSLSTPHSLVPVTKEKQEENLLYCSMDEPEVYSIKVVSTEAAVRNNLKENYKLIITSVNFSISEDSSPGRIGRVILTWPYRHIRRYGCSLESFSFEAGRKCLSGEGLFAFATNDGLKIFQGIDAQVSILKSTRGENDNLNSPCIKEDTNNFFSSKDSLMNNEKPMSPNIPKYQNPLSKINDLSEASLNSSDNLKTMPPFKKPPRKNKSDITDFGLDIVSPVTHPVAQNFVNHYAHIVEENNYVGLKETASSPYANRTFYSDVFSSDMPQSLAENVDGSQSSDNHGVKYCVEQMRTFEISKKETTHKNYENCGLVFDATPQFSSADHVYGKISNLKSSAASSTGHTYGSLTTNSKAGDPTPFYSNLINLKQSANESLHETGNDPRHFVKNDAEYAQVFKKK